MPPAKIDLPPAPQARYFLSILQFLAQTGTIASLRAAQSLCRKEVDVPLNRRVLAAAFRVTVPVLIGYLAIGIAFGLMLEAIGYNFIWAFFMSLSIYAGSGQYLGVSLLDLGAALSQVAFMTLLLNFRHIFYGLSLLEKFQTIHGLRKFYLIFALTDETYALLTSVRVPQHMRPADFYFAIAALDHSYWILGSVIGSVAGALLKFDTTGVDFAMTALFVVIAVGQWKENPRHLPAVIGGVCAFVSLYFIGPDNFLLPALGGITVLLLGLRGKLDCPEAASLPAEAAGAEAENDAEKEVDP